MKQKADCRSASGSPMALAHTLAVHCALLITRPLWATAAHAQPASQTLKSLDSQLPAANMSEAVLLGILSRAATVSGFLVPHTPGAPVAANTSDTIRMLAHTGTRYAGRSVFVWGSEGAIPKMLPHVKATAAAAHAAAPALVLEGAIFEIVTVIRELLPCAVSEVWFALDQLTTYRCRCADGWCGVTDNTPTGL